MKVNHLIISSLTQDEHEINMLFQERTYLSIDLCLIFWGIFLGGAKSFMKILQNSTAKLSPLLLQVMPLGPWRLEGYHSSVSPLK